MNILELSEQEIIRRNSLNELRAMGIDPYPAAEYVTNAFSTDIKAEFKDDEEPRQVSVAGRIMSRRVMGKASFVELQDSKGRIQVYITRDDICPGEDKELYNAVFKRLLDLGDFIGIEGFVFRTQMGEISIHAKKLTVLAKSIKPLPIVKYKDGVAYDSFEDPELRYRQRYVDLVVSPSRFQPSNADCGSSTSGLWILRARVPRCCQHPASPSGLRTVSRMMKATPCIFSAPPRISCHTRAMTYLNRSPP